MSELVHRLRQVDLHQFLLRVKEYLRQALYEWLPVATDQEYVTTDDNADIEESVEK